MNISAAGQVPPQQPQDDLPATQTRRRALAVEPLKETRGPELAREMKQMQGSDLRARRLAATQLIRAARMDIPANVTGRSSVPRAPGSGKGEDAARPGPQRRNPADAARDQELLAELSRLAVLPPKDRSSGEVAALGGQLDRHDFDLANQSTLFLAHMRSVLKSNELDKSLRSSAGSFIEGCEGAISARSRGGPEVIEAIAREVNGQPLAARQILASHCMLFMLNLHKAMLFVALQALPGETARHDDPVINKIIESLASMDIKTLDYLAEKSELLLEQSQALLVSHLRANSRVIELSLMKQCLAPILAAVIAQEPRQVSDAVEVAKEKQAAFLKLAGINGLSEDQKLASLKDSMSAAIATHTGGVGKPYMLVNGRDLVDGRVVTRKNAVNSAADRNFLGFNTAAREQASREQSNILLVRDGLNAFMRAENARLGRMG